jgi:lysine 6-dehydrogenase
MPRVIVLGAGRVGAAIALDLAADPRFDVTAADASPARLQALSAPTAPTAGAVRTLAVDLTDPRSLAAAVQDHDLAVGALPGPLGFQALARTLDAGTDVVDISFFEEDAFRLDPAARHNGVLALVDAGVAPGLSNLILGHHEATLQETRRFECLVGGIPAEPVPPWEYRAPFSPIDVIAEYTRPVRFRRAGRTVTAAALDELERVDVDDVGGLEAFLTDGLRTLLRTSRAPDLIEKTLRWPGHAERIRLLRESGFFDPVPRPVGSTSVAPLDLSAQLLFEAWRYRPGEEDLTVMRVTVEGSDAAGDVRHVYHLLDRHDRASGVSSMARTTGYTATALARLRLDGTIHGSGILPPEGAGALPGVLDHVLDQLRQRGVRVEHREERTGSPGD